MLIFLVRKVRSDFYFIHPRLRPDEVVFGGGGDADDALVYRR